MHPQILILGGSPFQIPLIRRAKARGLRVATCDYLPGNPGHKLADEYHDVSTTDRDGVLALARRIGADAVATLASDPAVQTVSYVAAALGLPGAPLSAVVPLTEKDAFRGLMRTAGLRTPASQVLTEADLPSLPDIAAALARSGRRHIVKPVDSCGSKGVTVLDAAAQDLPAALQRALGYSRTRRCIVEDYVEDGAQIEGDGYMMGGRLAYHYIGDDLLHTAAGSRIPVSTRWPSCQPADVIDDLVSQVEAIAAASGYLDGPVNIEALVTPAGDVWVLEVAPRNGGNHLPLIQERLSGFDCVGAVLDAALGEAVRVPAAGTRRDAGAHYILHADRPGRLAGVRCSDTLRPHLFMLDVFKQPGDEISPYAGSHTTIGVALMAFHDTSERDQLMDNIDDHIRIECRD